MKELNLRTFGKKVLSSQSANFPSTRKLEIISMNQIDSTQAPTKGHQNSNSHCVFSSVVILPKSLLLCLLVFDTEINILIFIIFTDDQWLVAFLRGCKYSLERTKEKLDLYYSLRSTAPEMYNVKFNSPRFNDILDTG